MFYDISKITRRKLNNKSSSHFVASTPYRWRHFRRPWQSTAGVDPNRTAMFFNYFFDYRQAQSGSSVLGGDIRFKNSFNLLIFNARSVIIKRYFDKIGIIFLHSVQAYFDQTLSIYSFECIFYQVMQY